MSENKYVEVSASQFLLFTSETNGAIEVRYEDGTIWLSQKLMAELFGVSAPTINEHLANIYDSQELVREATVRNFRMVEPRGRGRSRAASTTTTSTPSSRSATG